MTATLSTSQRLVTKGKIKARGWMPYLTHIFSLMRLEVTDKVETLAVDDNARLYVNEGFISTLSTPTLAYCLLHEVLHIALSHGKRFKHAVIDPGEKEKVCWNISADLCIQQLLESQIGVHAPEGIVHIKGRLPNGIPFLDIVKPNMTTEQYYSKLLPYMDGTGGRRGRGGNDTGSEDQGEGDKPDPQPLDPESSGSNATGDRKEWEKPPTLTGQTMVECALSEVEQAMDKHEEGSPGSVPGELRQSISVRLRKQPDPFDELRNVVSRSVASPVGMEEFTYQRRSRRQLPDQARKRGIRRYQPECTIVVDTSGSMMGCEQKALTTVAQGLRRVQSPKVCLFDHALQDEKRMSTIQDFEWKGYGGTDMTSAIRHADKGMADAIVVITDGETGWPETPTRARLIVALVRESRYATPPSWAKVIHCYKEVPTYVG